jgi:protein involved in sex pheromone biosynthesis
MKPRITVDGPMKSVLLVVIAGVLSVLSGCFDLEGHNRRAREEQDAKARAEAARKEMEILPKAFQTPDYFRVNQPAQKGDTQPSPSKNER